MYRKQSAEDHNRRTGSVLQTPNLRERKGLFEVSFPREEKCTMAVIHPVSWLGPTRQRGLKEYQEGETKCVYDTDREKESKRISREGDKSVHDTATVQL